MTEEKKNAYYRWIRADELFGEALERQFGKKTACDNRYCTHLHNEDTASARNAFVEAGNEYWNLKE